MGAAKESPATQVLEWAVGKLDEASKIDWVEKLSSLTASKPAYLRSGVLGAPAPSMPAPAPASSGRGVSQAELDSALARATQAEAKADSLAKRVAQLEQKLAGLNSHDQEVRLPAEAQEGDDEHKSHWWSRH
jgi:alanine dehydrogenase